MNAAAEIKQEKPILVILGNPPYSGHSANRSKGENGKLTFIGKLMEDYKKVDGKPLGERNPKWLHNDYMKFIRFAEWRLNKTLGETGGGIIGYITAHSYVDNPTFRGMRQHMIKAFEEIYIYDLHGDSVRHQEAPDGGRDENVFDIEQGVAILLGVKRKDSQKTARVFHADLWGSRDHKYAALSADDISSTKWTELKPVSPFYVFAPRDESLRVEYDKAWRLPDAFPFNVLGFQTHRDHFAIAFEQAAIRDRISQFRSKTLSDDEVRERFELPDNRDWHLSKARAECRAEKDWEEPIIQCLYRPFDNRWCYFSEVAMDYPRRGLLDNVAHRDNLCLGVGRQGIAVDDPEWYLLAVSTMPIDANIFRRGGINVFPLYLYGGGDAKQHEFDLGHKSKPNLNYDFMKDLAAHLDLPLTEPFGLPKGVTAEQIYQYAYAVFHAPTYRSRFADFLKSDFPHLPLTRDYKRFRALAKIGAELISTHLMQSANTKKLITRFPRKGSNVVEYVTYTDHEVRVHINPDQYFEGIARHIWDFYVGGYPVLQRWLGERKGRTLTYSEILHFQRVVVVLEETKALMKAADAAIGEWPLK